MYDSERILMMLYSIPAIFIGFTLHEFSHAYVADKLGDPTPRNHGRLTLNPMAHIDWIGFLLILVAGFGWAKPVQTNPRNYKNYKKGRILVSLAGPLANLVLAFIGFAIISFVFGFSDYRYFLYEIYTATSPNYWHMVVYQFTWINIILFAFNFLPIPPLDGFTLLEMWIKPSHYQKLAALRNYGIIIIIGLSFLGVLGTYLNFVYDIAAQGSFWLFRGIDWIIGLF